MKVIKKKSASPPPIHTWLIMLKTMQAVSHYALPPILEEGIGDSDFRVLEVLLHKGPMPVNAIGPLVDLNSGSVSVAVDRLHKKALVSRVESTCDRRVRTVSITEKGKQFFLPVFRRHTQTINSAFVDLSSEERLKLETLLKKVGFRAQALTQSRGCTA